LDSQAWVLSFIDIC